MTLNWKAAAYNVLFPQTPQWREPSLGLKEAPAGWDLCEKRQVANTTDNGTNIVIAVELNQ